jgi:hypothetical protein
MQADEQREWMSLTALPRSSEQSVSTPVARNQVLPASCTGGVLVAGGTFVILAIQVFYFKGTGPEPDRQVAIACRLLIKQHRSQQC